MGDPDGHACQAAGHGSQRGGQAAVATAKGFLVTTPAVRGARGLAYAVLGNSVSTADHGFGLSLSRRF